MTTAVRPALSVRTSNAVWPAIASMGGGLIQVALGAGAVTSADIAAAGRTVGIVLLLSGAASLAWGVVVLARGRTVPPHIGMTVSLMGAGVVVVGFVVDPIRLNVLAATPAAALLMVAGIGCAIERRCARSAAPRAARVTPHTRIIELIVCAIIVAAIVTPALSATEAGFLSPSDRAPAVLSGTGHHH